jgi:large subunit ribosomal protein L37Ae
MAKKKNDKLGSARRFGARYGRTVKHNFAKVEASQRASTKCPFCLYDSVTRKAMGSFECKKCDSTFTGKAYTVAPIKTLYQVKQDQSFSFKEEESQEEEDEK